MKWFFIFLVQIVILVSCGYFLIAYPGTLSVKWLGYQLETSLLVFFIVTLIVLITLGLLFKIISILIHIPAFFQAHFQKQSYEKGIRSLIDVLSSLFAMDGRQLAKKAQGLRLYLNERDLATFFEAEAAFLQENMGKAQQLFQSISQSEPFQFLAYYGITRIHLKLGEDQKALDWALKAKAVYETSPWVRETVINQAINRNDLSLALAELNETLKLDLGPVSELNDKKATILTKLAHQLKQQGELETALNYAEEAYEIARDKQEIGYLYAGLLGQLKGEQPALRLIEQLWTIAPEPKLADLYIKLSHPDSEMSKLRAVKRLTSFAPHHLESFLMIARAAIDAKLWGEAREHLNQLIAAGYETDVVLKLMADLKG